MHNSRLSPLNPFPVCTAHQPPAGWDGDFQGAGPASNYLALALALLMLVPSSNACMGLPPHDIAMYS